MQKVEQCDSYALGKCSGVRELKLTEEKKNYIKVFQIERTEIDQKNLKR